MISFHGETDIGRRRILNEDAIFADSDLFVVCDGMGGHKAAEGVWGAAGLSASGVAAG